MDETKYRENLGKLGRNRQKCDEKTLRTTYKEAYDKIRSDLKLDTESFIKERIYKNIVVLTSDGDEVIANIQKAITQSGLLEKISAAVYEEQSFEKVELHTQEMADLVLQTWTPYFQSHTCLLLEKECFEDPPAVPKIYNDLIHQYYDDEKKEWYREEEKNDIT